MKVLIFGATGMVGQAVLRECLAAPDVESVVAVGRTRPGVEHPRLVNLRAPDLFDLNPIAGQLAPFDACFFCLGVSSVGMSEADYQRVTYDLTLNAARTLVQANPQMTFVYITGAGTDSSEAGETMWARVKGRTENALLGLGFKAAYMFRPGVIRPLHAVRSKTALYRVAYVLATPLFGLMQAIRPGALVTSVEVGQAMLSVARHGYPQPILEVLDIQKAARAAAP
jgi:uncharacterized protein YbjT (DUF2867 family)